MKLSLKESELIAREIGLLSKDSSPESAQKIKALLEQEEVLKKQRSDTQLVHESSIGDEKLAQKRRRKAAREARDKARHDAKELEEVLHKELVQSTEGFLKSSEQPPSFDLGWGNLDYPENDVFYYRGMA